MLVCEGLLYFSPKPTWRPKSCAIQTHRWSCDGPTLMGRSQTVWCRQDLGHIRKEERGESVFDSGFLTHARCECECVSSCSHTNLIRIQSVSLKQIYTRAQTKWENTIVLSSSTHIHTHAPSNTSFPRHTKEGCTNISLRLIQRYSFKLTCAAFRSANFVIFAIWASSDKRSLSTNPNVFCFSSSYFCMRVSISLSFVSVLGADWEFLRVRMWERTLLRERHTLSTVMRTLPFGR